MQCKLRDLAVICSAAYGLCVSAGPLAARQVSWLLVDRGPWVGAVTPTSATVKVKVAREGAVTRLSCAAAGGPATFSELHKAGQSRIVGFELRNLKASTHYFYNVE